MVVADYKAAVAGRDAAKATLEALEQELQGHNTTPLDAPTVDVYVTESANLKTQLLELHTVIHVNAPASTDMIPHNAEHNDLFKRAARLHTAWKGIKFTFPAQAPAAPSSSMIPTVRLPALELPSFGGNLQEWVSFRDIFESAVGNSSHLSKSQKLTYLKTCLVGEAAKHIRSLVLSDANYDIAWKALTDRYQNERELLFSILRRMMNQPNVSSTSSSVRQLIDTTKECTRSLEVLKVPVQHWDSIIIFVMFQKLDSSSRELWEQQLKDSTIPDLDGMYTFLEQRARALAASATTTPRVNPPKQQQQRHQAQNFHMEPSAQCKLECVGNQHPMYLCRKFRDMSVPDRVSYLKSKNMCLNCFGEGHFSSKCGNKHSCKTCGSRHHTLIHQSSAPQRQQTSPSYNSQVLATVNNHHIQNSDLELGMLSTALVRVIDSSGQLHPCRVMLDSGSPVCIISEACKTRIGLSSKSKSTSMCGLQGVSVGTSNAITTFALTTHFQSDMNLTVTALIMPRITKNQPPLPHDITEWPHIKNLRLADPKFNIPATVDILLGSDIFYTILESGKIPGPNGAPYAINSSLGWLVGGKTSGEIEQISSFVTDISLDNKLQQFWEAEGLPEETKFTEEERMCEEHFLNNHTRDDSGRFIVTIPTKPEISTLGSSRSHATLRLHQLEKRLSSHKNPEINTKRLRQREEYNKFMEEYEQMGHMTLIPDAEITSSSSPTYYIPHHFIEKPTSTTTKFRVVFDASAKTTSGSSLNEMMMIGPVVQDSLLSILIRFRKHPVAFTADIEKMYRQILINPKQRDLQRIVFRTHPSLPIRDYRLNTVTYGTASAPYLATRCLKQLANDSAVSHPLASPILDSDAYVDDIQSGSSSIPSAIATIEQLNSLCSTARLPLRKWTCNNEQVLSSIPVELRETKSLIPVDTDHTVKTLGIFWNPQADEYLFQINLPVEVKSYTKRIILSEMSKIFDPLGWLTPVIISAKIFMQLLWKDHHDWDSVLPEHIQTKWKLFRKELHKLESVMIPRCVIKGSPCRVTLCCFSDASNVAFSSCVYTCCYYVNSEPEAYLVAAKSRVAPLDSPSIPRLELCGAVLLSSLTLQVTTAMKYKFDEVNCYTDSTITLAWINSTPQRWKTYVRRRVQMIHDNYPNANWFHVAGETNPADCASRGIEPAALIHHSLWWNGNTEMFSSPSQKQIKQPEDIFVSVKHEEKVNKPTADELHIHTTTTADCYLQHFSSLTKATRVTAWILRFVHNSLAKRKENPLICGCLSTTEHLTAHNKIICLLQNEAFSTDLDLLRKGMELKSNSKILPLSPFLDDQGILRVGGRLKHATWSTQRRNPILLPNHHSIVKLLIMDTHLKYLHSGPQLTQSILSQRYWIISGRNAIRYTLKKCITCTRHRAVTMQQFMGHLPAARVNPAPVFSKTGVDYAGPFIIKPPTRSKVQLKAYMAIFVCFATKAIHLELVNSLSTNDFIAALRRFISRRGLPTDLYSDCGTNFVGASRVLRDLFSNYRSKSHNNQVSDECTRYGIQWHFNPAGAPHFGGLWEAGVKSVKHHLTRVIGSSRLTYHELETLLVQVEGILNSRPITPASSDPHDLEALTPAHFLIGRPLTSLPDPDLSEINVGRLDRWQLIQQQQQMFWNRWSKEHVTRLQQRPKWMKITNQIKVGNLVLIKEERLPPLKWKLGRVLQVYPGSDDIVRTVLLKAAEGEITRPIHKLCLLPVDDPKD